jgi:Mrp family chromosome partitioning ATPase
MPTLIAVASATETDNTEPVARGLARVSRDAGQRTGYLYLGPRRPPVAEQKVAYTHLSLMNRPSLRESFDASLESWRDSFDVIIIEVPQLTLNQLGAHVARLAEGVVIALYPGRKVEPADRELTSLLAQLSATIIGVVKTSATTSTTTPSPVASKSLTSRFFPARLQP